MPMTITGAGFPNPMTTLGDTIVGGASGLPQRLAQGANGSFLGVSGGVLGYYAGVPNLITTQGDLVVGGVAGAPTRLPQGSNTTFLGVSGGVLGYYAALSWPLANSGDEGFQPNGVSSNLLTLRNSTGLDQGLLVTGAGGTGTSFAFVASSDATFPTVGSTVWPVPLSQISGAGHLLVAIIEQNNCQNAINQITSVTDDGGNRWVAVFNENQGTANAPAASVYYTNTETAPVTTVTVIGNQAPGSGSNGASPAAVRILEFSGSAFPAGDGFAEQYQTTNNTQSSGNSPTPSTTTDLAIGWAGWSLINTVTVTGESTNFTANTPSILKSVQGSGGSNGFGGLHTAYRILASAAVQNYAINLSGSNNGGKTGVALFKPGSAGGAIKSINMVVQSATQANLGIVLGVKGTGAVTIPAMISSAISGGALPTQSFSSGTGSQVLTSRDVDVWVPVTYTPTAGAAATCVVALSPDGQTYSTLSTETVPLGTALDSFISSVHLHLPAGWYLKLTVTNATLGTATYY